LLILQAGIGTQLGLNVGRHLRVIRRLRASNHKRQHDKKRSYPQNGPVFRFHDELLKINRAGATQFNPVA
jgi:hypothetical protein